MSTGKSGITNMNLKKKVSSRLTELRSRRGTESGYVDLCSIIITIVIILWVTISFVVFANAIADNARTQSIAEETITAYDMIYESYNARAESIEDKSELNEALEEITENYRLARDDEELYVTSEATGEDSITVTVSRRDGNSNVVFSAKFATGDEEPSTSKNKLSGGNDVRDLEGALSFE